MIYYAKVFCDHPDGGNLAGVVPHADGLSQEVMQRIAKQVGASETAFVFPSDKADFKIRWFTPNAEVGVCVHATIASLATLRKLRKLMGDEVRVETKNTVLQCRFMDGKWFVRLEGYRLLEKEVDLGVLLKLLGLKDGDLLAGRPRIVQIFDDLELIVPVRSLSVLKRLEPDIDIYAGLCKQCGVTGISIFTMETFDRSNTLHTREFAPLYGYLEDPLCGMAAGAIASYLGAGALEDLLPHKRGDSLQARGEAEPLRNRTDSSCNPAPEGTGLRIEQGNFLDSPGVIDVLAAENGFWIGGAHYVLPEVLGKNPACL